MSSIRDLAREFDAQPHEIAAFADLGAGYDETAEFDAETETMIREAWAMASAAEITPAPLTDYTVEIQVSSAEGDIWQAIHTEHIESDLTAIEIAEDTAQNQNVAEGETWRVRVYLGDDNGHVAEAGPRVDGGSLTELANAIAALAGMPPLERANRASILAGEIRMMLARVRRAAVYEATRTASWTEIAAALGVSEAAVNKAITQHRELR